MMDPAEKLQVLDKGIGIVLDDLERATMISRVLVDMLADVGLEVPEGVQILAVPKGTTQEWAQRLLAMQILARSEESYVQVPFEL